LTSGRDPEDDLAPRRRWSEERIVKALLELDRRGVPISQRGLIEAGEHKLAQVINYFGGLRMARRLAGLPPPARRPARSQLSGDDVVTEIQRRRSDGEPLASSHVPQALLNAAQRVFGNWGAAVKAAGFDYDAIRLTRAYSDADLLQHVRGLAREQPHATLGELSQQPLASTLRERFGSLEAAALRAGVPGWPVRRRTSYARRR
jgi:hypothetical protein